MKSLGAAIAIAGLVLGLVSACGSSSDSGDSRDGAIKLGTSLPLNGPLAQFGEFLNSGYQQAIDDVNARGGLRVGDSKRKVELVVRDNKTDPTLATQQIRALVQEEGVTALLGSATPPLNIPISSVADSLQTPVVMTGTPLQAWLGANEDGWKYGWDFFIDEDQFTDLQFEVADLVRTNKKIALFTDNEQDGQVMGRLWTKKAARFGYEIATHAVFPVGTTDFSTYINDAKSAGAEVVIAQMVPPDGIALWKQMKSLSFHPRVAFCEKCSNTAGWGMALKELAVGTCQLGYWSKSLGYPGTDGLVEKFEPQTGNTDDLSAIAVAYTAAAVEMDAIKRAGSIDPSKINDAIGRTDGTYVAGPIKFASNHTSTIAPEEKQWTNPTTQSVIYPPSKAQTKLVAPVEGLR